MMERQRKMKVRITRRNVAAFIEKAISEKKYEEALDLVRRFKAVGFTISLTTLKKEYRASDEQIAQLHSLEVKNPHYSCAPPMHLYIKNEVEVMLGKPLSNEGMDEGTSLI